VRDGIQGDGDIQRGRRDYQDSLDSGVGDQVSIVWEELDAVDSGLPIAFLYVLSANGHELATGFFFDKMPKISTAMTSKSNEPY
jgi:hypothetical protein